MDLRSAQAMRLPTSAILIVSLLLVRILSSQVMAQAPRKPPIDKVICADPGVPDFGYRHGNPQVPGAIISFGCQNGYELRGATVRRCSYVKDVGRSGWSGVQPICDRVLCPMIPVLKYGRVDATSLTYESLAQFYCRPGYALSSASAGVIRCESNGHWSHKFPTCNPISCGVPEKMLPRGLRRTGSQLTFGSEVKYSCTDKTRRLVGDELRLCLADGTWSGSLPLCEVLECPAPKKIVGGSWEVTWNQAKNHTTLTYLCSDGFSLAGASSTRVCFSNGSWSNVAPTCVARLTPSSATVTITGEVALSSTATDERNGTFDIANGTDTDATPNGGVSNVVSGGSILEQIPILAGAVCSGILVLLLVLVVWLYISNKRKKNSQTKKSKDEPEIYANSGLFSPEHSQNGSVGNTPLSASSSKLHSTRTSQSAINGDTLSEESSQMSSETPPLPPPPDDIELQSTDTAIKFAQFHTHTPTEAVSSSTRISTLSLGAALGQAAVATIQNKKDRRKSEPLPAATKPVRPPVPRADYPMKTSVEEDEYANDELYDDTLVRMVIPRYHGGTISKRPAAPLPESSSKVTAVPSLNPLERLHRSYQDQREREGEIGMTSTVGLDQQYNNAVQGAPDEGCYSEIDCDDDNDEEHLYEPAPSGLGNRLSFSYDDVVESDNDEHLIVVSHQASNNKKKDTMALQWGELQSDMAIVSSQLEMKSPGINPPLPGTEDYDLPADAIGKGGRHQTISRTLKHNKGLPRRVPPPVMAKQPASSVHGKAANHRPTMPTTNSASSFQSDDYHLPIDATPIGFTTAPRSDGPYDVPLESIDFVEIQQGDYACPADCPSSGQNSRHSSQRRKAIVIQPVKT